MEWKRAQLVDGKLDVPSSWVYSDYYEAFNLLFRIESALRVFVYVVLKTHMKDKWADTYVVGDEGEGTIASLAKKRLGQARTFGYLGYAIACPIMHLNGGELTRLITSDAYWSLFKRYFFGSKDIIKNKLDEVASIRNSLAHFRPIHSDDIDVIKQNSKHCLLGVEKLMKQVLVQNDVVPTNTGEGWYTSLRTLGTDECSLVFRQSADTKWIRIGLHFNCPVVDKRVPFESHVRYSVLTIVSSAILRICPYIATNICFLSESTSYPRMQEDSDARFSKTLGLVFERATLVTEQASVRESLEGLLRTLSEEAELIQQDHLARGQLVQAVSCSASRVKGPERPRWQWQYTKLETPVTEDDPPEYWGDLNFDELDDFIAAASRYPWMPAAVSEAEIPF